MTRPLVGPAADADGPVALVGGGAVGVWDERGSASGRRQCVSKPRARNMSRTSSMRSCDGGSTPERL